MASAFMVLAGCGQPLTPDEVAFKYYRTPWVFEELKRMIDEDVGTRECLEVGLDVIGKYRKQGNSWSRDSGRTKESIAEALAAVALNSERYDTYRKLLYSSQTERVLSCPSQGGRQVSVLTHRSGLVSGGCMSDIRWRSSPPAALVQSDSDGYRYREIRILGKGWFVEFTCT
jgi:hypothetical protein